MKNTKTLIRQLIRRYIHVKKRTIAVIGDSHVNFFGGSEQISWKPLSSQYRINICPRKHKHFDAIHVGAVLAYHADTPGSSTKFTDKIQWLENNFLNKGDTVIFSLGEIDIRVHVLKQALTQNKNYKTIIDGIVNHYISFLRQMKIKGYDVWCWGPVASKKENLPIQNTPYEYSGSERERNRATEYFNRELERQCSINKIGFASIFEQLIAEDYSTKGEYFADSCHLNQKAWKLFQDRYPDNKKRHYK